MNIYNKKNDNNFNNIFNHKKTLEIERERTLSLKNHDKNTHDKTRMSFDKNYQGSKNDITILNRLKDDHEKNTLVLNIYDIKNQDNKKLVFDTKNVNAQNDNTQNDNTQNDNTQNDTIHSKMLDKLKITKIYNVYQPEYKNKIKPTGLGDFIRGCYFLLKFCDECHLKINIIFNHPIHKFLKNSQIPLIHSINSNKVFSNIIPFTENNWNGYKVDNDNNIFTIIGNKINRSFFRYLLRNKNIYNNDSDISIFTYVIAYPGDYNRVAPSKTHRDYMKNILTPSDEMDEYVNEKLNVLGLIPHNYSCIHIRSGDDYFKNDNKNSISQKYLQKLIYEIFNIAINNTNKFLLISDNNKLKMILIKEFPFLKTLFGNITHFGDVHDSNDLTIKNTLCDFYILSKSTNIYSFSCYEHGTGFSKWCAETYDIPYSCKLIQ